MRNYIPTGNQIRVTKMVTKSKKIIKKKIFLFAKRDNFPKQNVRGELDNCFRQFKIIYLLIVFVLLLLLAEILSYLLVTRCRYWREK